MTANDGFDRDLQGWLETQTPTMAPAGLHDAVIDRARRSRQRPSWLVGLRGGTFGGSLRPLDRPAVGVAYLLVILALVLAIIVAAVAGGAFRRDHLELGNNGAIAYSVRDFSQRDRPESLHLIQRDGIDRPIGFGSCPTFSREGSVLAFRTGIVDKTEVNIAASDGSDQHVVPGLGESDFALSPDGTQVAWFRSLGPITSPDGLTTVGLKNELWLTPVAGGPGLRILPAADGPNEWYGNPVWSPDGRHIAFGANVSLFPADGGGGSYRSAIDVVDTDGTHLRPLTARAGTDATGISWSPDARYIAFVGLRDGSPLPSLGTGTDPTAGFQPPVDLFVTRVDGTEERDITNSAADELDPDWAPDGTHLAYWTAEDGGHLAIVRMDGPVAVGSPILRPPSIYAWSPDGTKLVLVDSVVTDPSVDPSVDPQSVRTIIRSVDVESRQPPTTLLSLVYDISCAPSWQRLAP